MTVSVEIPAKLYELIRRRAEREGKLPEEIIVEAFLEHVDPESRVKVYLELHEKYLRDAEGLSSEGDIVQASEKYWGAVAALLGVIGEREGLPHYTHRDLVEVIEHIALKTSDPEVSTLFRLAEGLHANFYHNFLRKETFDRHKEGVLKLIAKLKEYLENIS